MKRVNNIYNKICDIDVIMDFSLHSQEKNDKGVYLFSVYLFQNVLSGNSQGGS